MKEKWIKPSFQTDKGKVTRTGPVDGSNDIDKELLRLGRLIKKDCHIT
jgi:hypothetical protein